MINPVKMDPIWMELRITDQATYSVLWGSVSRKLARASALSLTRSVREKLWSPLRSKEGTKLPLFSLTFLLLFLLLLLLFPSSNNLIEGEVLLD